MGAPLKLKTLLIVSAATLTGLALTSSLRWLSSRQPAATGQSTVMAGRELHSIQAPLSRRQSPDSPRRHPVSVQPSVESPGVEPLVVMNPAQSTDLVSGVSPVSYWQDWRTALLTDDVRQIPVLGGQLAEHLREFPDSGIYQEITQLVNDPNLSIESKSLLVDLLGEIATTEAMAALMLVAQEGKNSPLYLASLQGISQIAANHWGGRFHEELSSGLENAWQDLQSKDPAYAATLAKAIANIGAPSGMEVLFNSLTDPSRQANADDRSRLKQKTAFAAIPEVKNPAAIEVLSQRFMQDSIETPGFEVSGLALASMGSPDATENLLNWAEIAPAGAASRVEDWISRIHDSASVDMLLTRQSTLTFQSEAVESAFTQALSRLSPPLEELTPLVSQSSVSDQYGNTATDLPAQVAPAADSAASADTTLSAILDAISGSEGQGQSTLQQALESDAVIKHVKKKSRR